jgi:hypothetical protein
MPDNNPMINYPMEVKIVKNDHIVELLINRYKVLRPLDGEGYSIKYINPKIYLEGLGGVISDYILKFKIKNLFGNFDQLNEYEKIVLVVRAHETKEFFDLSKQNEGRPNEFLIATTNYEKLIDRTEDLRLVKDDILHVLFTYYNYFPQSFMNIFDLYCSLPYQISTILRGVALLKEIKDIQQKVVLGSSKWGAVFKLNPEIYKTLENKFAISPQASKLHIRY